jgi:hypothetical protein
MKYMINFQIVVFFKSSKKDLFRTSYTVLEEEINHNKLDSFDIINTWFNRFFHFCSLDNFIDTATFDEEITKVELKIGRITNGLSGEYQTY